MGAWEFRGKQWLVISDASSEFNPQPQITVEALCQLLGAGHNPTIFCRPIGATWKPPYVVWRLGFYSDQRKPEFQILFAGDRVPTTVRSDKPVALHEIVHLAGTYDGDSVRLYVNGVLVATAVRHGHPAASEQSVFIGTRSAKARGGYFVGRLFDLRFWKVARTPEQIDLWKNRTLPVPIPDEGCVGYWHTEPRLQWESREHMSNDGFSGQDLSFLDFLNQYSLAYPESASRLLKSETLELYPSQIHTTLVIKVGDGYIAFYEPRPAEYLSRFPFASDLDAERGGLLVLRPSGSSAAETIQGLTKNVIKLSSSSTEEGVGVAEFPEDSTQAVDWMVSKELREQPALLPQVLISVPQSRETAGSTIQGHKRIRIIAPVVADGGGRLVRVFTWLFADLWLGDIGWDHTIKGFAEALAFNDALAIQLLSGFVYPAGRVTRIDPGQALLPMENRIEEFRDLIERHAVDEVRDILPFLAKPENWFLMSPTCEYVWPEKRLGNKWRVDFLVREPGNLYTAVEIESPAKRLYSTGRDVDPYREFSQAEQQVRDYCNFIDRNRDYVDREEGLPGIYKPNGVVVIGRRATLSPEGAQKLQERNADSGRYTVKTFDDLIDQAEAMVQRLRAVT